METSERAALVSLYERRYDELGRDVRSLGWKSTTDQELRFAVLCGIGDLSGASICDIGCGFADLLPYLRERFHDVTYTGVDVTPSFVDEARRRFPEATFHCLDILEQPFAQRFDYFLLSGALNYCVADNERLTKGMLARMFELADRGVAANFLSTDVNFQRPINFHHDPLITFRWARQLTKWVTLRHDYPLWEFTLYLHKQPQGTTGELD